MARRLIRATKCLGLWSNTMFLVFGGQAHYAKGGMSDLIGSYYDLNEAKWLIDYYGDDLEWVQIYDTD